MSITAIYPGSFDPITLGHVDVVARASKMFDRIIMAVLQNAQKRALFEPQQRVELIQESVKHLPKVDVMAFEGLMVDFARDQGATVIIRGLRAISDFEYEFQMSQMNKTLFKDAETVFIMSSLDYTFLSSSIVKEVVTLGGDVSTLVPAPVKHALQSIYPHTFANDN